MKEIGERLKEAREAIGISMEEAAEDLKMRVSQIENIEAGNMEVFKDVFYLKYFIRDYAKYLGLDYEDMVDEFNEYLFDYTSKISIEEIKKAKKETPKEEKEEKRVHSPYTIEHKRKSWFFYFMIFLLLIGIGVLAFYFLTKDQKKDPNGQIVAMNVLRIR